MQFKDVKTAPKIEEFVEPEIIPAADNELSEAAAEYAKVLNEITELKSSLDTQTAALKTSIDQISKPINTAILEKQATLKTLLDNIHNKVGSLEDKIVTYQGDIYAAVERETAKAPTASLAQIIKYAKAEAPEIAEGIAKIKAALENKNTQLVIEKFLYKYPVSKTQEKKIESALESALQTELYGDVEEVEVADYDDLLSTLVDANELLHEYNQLLTAV